MKKTMAHKFSEKVKQGLVDPRKIKEAEGALLVDYVTFSDGSVYKISTDTVVAV